MPVNKFTPFTINPNRRISCTEISKSKNSEKHEGYVIGYNKSTEYIVRLYTNNTSIMTYNIAKLAEFNPALAAELKNRCYTIVGLCQQVHREMGPFLNEYMYQEALDISLEENGIERVKEYYFSVTYHGRQIKHKHYVDFLVNNDVLVECKAVEHLGPEQRQQLWNYMRLTKICIGILYNFAPVHDQCERYYLDKETGNMYMF